MGNKVLHFGSYSPLSCRNMPSQKTKEKESIQWNTRLNILVLEKNARKHPMKLFPWCPLSDWMFGSGRISLPVIPSRLHITASQITESTSQMYHKSLLFTTQRHLVHSAETFWTLCQWCQTVFWNVSTSIVAMIALTFHSTVPRLRSRKTCPSTVPSVVLKG